MPDKNRQSPEKNPGSPMDQSPSTQKQPSQSSGRRSQDHTHQPKERENPEDQGELKREDSEHPTQQGFRGRGGGPGRADDIEETAQGG